MASNSLPTPVGYIPTGVRSFGRSFRKYNTATDMQVAMEAYFDLCERGKRPYTTNGLALGIGMTPRTLWDNWAKHPDFKDVVEWARAVIIEQVESKLLEGEIQPNGLMFWLKNKADYVDKTEIEHSGDIGIAKAMQEARRRVRDRQMAEDSGKVIDITNKMHESAIEAVSNGEQ